MYSLTRSLIGPNEARTLIQVRVVVSTTSASEMPSMPSLYWMPKAGTQSAVSRNWKPAAPTSKPASSSSETTHVARAVSSAAQRMAVSRSRGSRAITATPTSGRKVTIDSSGKLRRASIIRRSPSVHHEQVGHRDDQQAGGDA